MRNMGKKCFVANEQKVLIFGLLARTLTINNLLKGLGTWHSYLLQSNDHMTYEIVTLELYNISIIINFLNTFFKLQEISSLLTFFLLTLLLIDDSNRVKHLQDKRLRYQEQSFMSSSATENFHILSIYITSEIINLTTVKSFFLF